MRLFPAYRCRRPLAALFLLLIAGALPGAVPAWAQMPPPMPFAAGSLTIHAADGPHKFAVELAENEAQRERGLMFRTDLAPDHGMLFDFKEDVYAAMWMKNTLVPLDMLFMDAGGRVTFIRANAVPGSLDIIQAPGRSRFVLELLAGTVARLGLKVGDQVTLPAVK